MASLAASSEFESWVDAQMNRPLQVTVNDPQTTGTFKRVTTYAVVSVIQEGVDEASVRRRYSDFEWLWTVLCARYPGTIIPVLPGKSMFGSGEEFLKARQEGLNDFMKRLMQNPFFKADETVQKFLKSDAKGSTWDKLKKEESAAAAEKWTQRSTATPTAARFAARMKQLGEEEDGGRRSEERAKASLARYSTFADKGGKAVAAAISAVNAFAQSMRPWTPKSRRCRSAARASASTAARSPSTGPARTVRSTSRRLRGHSRAYLQP